ncbi:MAG: hypothetical protein U0793_06745 [Gemmataceae bacterium]
MNPSIDIRKAGGGFGAWGRFWFSAADPIGLHVLRVLTGLLLLFWLLPFAGQHEALFSLAGWADSQLFESISDIQPPDSPPVPIGWSILYMAGENTTAINVIYWLSIVVLGLFTLGIAVRLTALGAWIIAVSFLSSPVVAYDVDYLLLIPTFYVMLGYLFYGQYSRPATPLERIFGPRDVYLTRLFAPERGPEYRSYAANFAVRLFQVHFAIVVVVSALHKLQMAEWWSGVAMFFPLHSPYKTTARDLIDLRSSASAYFFVLSVCGYLMLAWQLAFPAFAWRRGWRWLSIGGAVVGWLGCVFIFGLPLFGPFYLVGCLAYLRPEEWRSSLGWIVRLFKSRTTAAPAPRRASEESPRSVKATRV